MRRKKNLDGTDVRFHATVRVSHVNCSFIFLEEKRLALMVLLNFVGFQALLAIAIVNEFLKPVTGPSSNSSVKGFKAKERDSLPPLSSQGGLCTRH